MLFELIPKQKAQKNWLIPIKMPVIIGLIPIPPPINLLGFDESYFLGCQSI